MRVCKRVGSPFAHAETRAGIRDQRDPGAVFVPDLGVQWKRCLCRWVLTGKICLCVSAGRTTSVYFLMQLSLVENRI